MDTRSARSRGVAAIVASLALLGSGAAITTSPAQSAPPEQDCAEAFPVTSITKGQPVDGLTVTEGTDPSPFAGKVIGVLKDGIAPGVDMILADLANPTGDPANDTRIDEVGGIWQGMSGSPVYAENGQLLGAVSYGLSFGPSTVAGITPYEQMDDYLPAQEVNLPAGMARRVAAGTDLTARQAGDGMSQLRVPLSIGGISQARLQDVRSGDQRQYLHHEGRVTKLVGTSGPGVMADESDVVDGGNLGAAISYGTITAGGVGTVTDRCGDAVVGFGHPMMFRGSTSLGLMPADALYVQKESIGAPFKVANLAMPTGTITQDRLTGITGAVGQMPSDVPIVSDVTYAARHRVGESHALSSDWVTDVTLMQLLSMHDVTIDGIQPGSEESGLEITASEDGGEPVTLVTRDRFVSDYDIAVESLWPTFELLYALSRIDGVEISAIDTDATVTDSTDTLRIGQVQQKRGGEWVTVGRRTPAVGRAGELLRLRVGLRGPDGSTWLPQQVRVPAKAAGKEGRLQVLGGSWTWNDDLWEADSLADAQQALAGDVRNDQVETSLDFYSRRSHLGTRAVSEAQSLVVAGHRAARVAVRR